MKRFLLFVAFVVLILPVLLGAALGVAIGMSILIAPESGTLQIFLTTAAAFVLWVLMAVYVYRRMFRHHRPPKRKSVAAAEQSGPPAKAALGTANPERSAEVTRKPSLVAVCRRMFSREGNLDAKYQKKLAIYETLCREIAVYDEKLSFIELGVYEPHFDFGDSKHFKAEIVACRARQKDSIAAKTSCTYPDNFTLDGSLSKGRSMMNRQLRLTMRAFNNECEAAIANTRWNNVNAMERRILNSAKQINAANQSLGVEITDAYVALKLHELYLTHEYCEQQKVEKDARAEQARQEREEKALLRAAEQAEREEARRRQELEQAQAEAKDGELTDELRQRIAALEAALEAAHVEAKRFRSLAERTKSGYVYVISNVGAFGGDIVKIGMTRRLDPDDRVKELSDASVPFSFDTHAMIYSDEAPALESALHKEFGDRRVNMANLRKEFFRVSLDQVEEAVRRLAPKASFIKDREAQEWHETRARRNEVLEAEHAFPSTLSDP